MTRKIGDTVYIEPQAPGVCELCDQVAELRPYGPNGESICFDCGMKNPRATAQRFAQFVTGPGEKKQ